MNIAIHSSNPRKTFQRFMRSFKKEGIIGIFEKSSNDHLGSINLNNIEQATIGNKKSRLLLPKQFYTNSKEVSIHYIKDDSDLFSDDTFRYIGENNSNAHIVFIGISPESVEMTVDVNNMTDTDIYATFLKLKRGKRYNIFELHYNKNNFGCFLYDIKYFDSIEINKTVYGDKVLDNVDGLNLLIIVEANKEVDIEKNFKTIFTRFFN